MRRELTTKLKRKADFWETCIIMINLLEFLGIVLKAWVMLERLGETPDAEGDPKLI